MNHVMVIGRLTRDSELVHTVNGHSVLRFSLAVNRRRKSKEGWEQEGNKRSRVAIEAKDILFLN